MMDDLISRKAVRDGMKKYGFHAPDMTVHEFVADELPSVPAVPLDNLCNLLSQHLGKIRCNDCWVACSDPCPRTADDWRRVVTKWMEGLDAAD